MTPSPKVSTIITFTKPCPFSNPFCHHKIHNHLQLVLPLNKHMQLVLPLIPLRFLNIAGFRCRWCGTITESQHHNNHNNIFQVHCPFQVRLSPLNSVTRVAGATINMHLNHNNNQLIFIFILDCHYFTTLSFLNTIVAHKPFK